MTKKYRKPKKPTTTADAFKVVHEIGAALDYLWADAFLAIRRDTPAVVYNDPHPIDVAPWVTDAAMRLVALERYLLGNPAMVIAVNRYDVLRDAWGTVFRECLGLSHQTLSNSERCLENIATKAKDQGPTYGED